METTNSNNANQLVQTSTQPVAVNYFDERQFAVVQRVCRLFASADLVPDSYKTSKQGETKAIANCVIALEMANRIGASPLMVMQNMVPIYGRPSWSASFLIATVNSCGRFKPLKYKFTEKGMLGMVDLPGGKQYDGKKIMDVECVAYTTERDSDELLESSPISIRLAVMEGWYTKNGSKWQTMPRQMLMYRAAAFWVRAYAPELSMGMHTTEEWQDVQETRYEEIRNEVAEEIDLNANLEELSIDETETTEETTVEVAPKEETADEVAPKEETKKTTAKETKPKAKETPEQAQPVMEF